jgi:two-component system, OmpR family, response regulator MprA
MAAESPSPPRVLVVDDEETIVDFVTMGLEHAGFAVTAARDGRAALAAFEAEPPDLIVLDWMLPGVDGLQVCRRIRARSDVPILMLTARGEVDDRVEGLEGGADDYLPKPFKFKELLARVRALLRRHRPVGDAVLAAGDLVLNNLTREVQRAGRAIALTPREFDLLQLLLSRPRQVFTRSLIMDRLWGDPDAADTNVLDVHVRSLREKIGDRDRALIQTVRGVGFALRP